MRIKPLAALIAALSLLFSLMEIPLAQAESTNRCLQFSGNNYAEIGSKLIPVDKDFTVEMWVYSFPANNGRFAEFISQNDQPFAFYMGVDPNGYLRMGDIWMDTGIKLPTNTWTHVALTHTSTDILFLYVNGEIVAKKLAGKTAYNTSGTNTRLGSYYWANPGEFFSGCLDEVRIWSIIRTPTEILNYKDVNAVSITSTGLLASYSFDMLKAIDNSVSRLTYDYQPSSAVDSQVFVAKNGALKVPPRGNLISDSISKDCGLQNSASSITQQQNLPKVLKVNARDSNQTSLDLLINGLPEGTCVGMDTFVIGTTEPIRSTVGIVSAIDSAGNTAKFRMNLDTSAHECGDGTNNKIEVRGWWAYQGRYSQYGEPFQIPKCFGTIPAQGSSLIPQQSYVSLVGENGIQSPWALQTALRLKNAGLIPAAMRTTNVVSDVVKDLNGCHAPVMLAILQKISNGSWVDVGNFDSWEKATNCDPVHPTRPIKAVSLPDTTVLRWKVSNKADWEVYSAPFIHVAGASATTGTSTSTNTTSAALETPTNFSVSLQGDVLQIRVTLPAKTRSKVSSVALVSTGLGFLANNPLIGAAESSFGVFRIPLAKLEGKSGLQRVLIESRGLGITSSPQLTGDIDLSKYTAKASASPTPKVTSKASPTPKATVKATLKPKVTRPPVTPKPSKTTAVNAIKCSKGSIVRTFLAKTCPPGWKIYG